jgi:hypothetical protein
MRSAVLLSFLAACSVGEVPGNGAVSDSGTADGSGSGSDCIDRKTPATAHGHSGVPTDTRGGQGCIMSGCHLTGMTGLDAPEFQFAGTLYKTGGTAPNPGATIRIKSGTMEAKAVADSAGNFYVEVGVLPAMPFPANTFATACPTTTPMTTALTTGGGNCNAGVGCHTSSMPITLADQ